MKEKISLLFTSKMPAHCKNILPGFVRHLTVAGMFLLFLVLHAGGQINWNFETGNLQGWSRTGTAFNTQPTYGNNVSARRPGLLINIQGLYWLGTYENHPYSYGAAATQGDAPTGILTSDPFMLTTGNVSFLIGGGNDINRVRVELLIKLAPGEAPPPVILGIGELVTLADGVYYIGIYATGRNDEVMRRETFEIERRFERRTARIRIVDNSSQAWGHINVDDFQFSADPPGDVWIKGVEITQAIQNYSETGVPSSLNAVPLIARKPTVLRIYTQSRVDSRGPWSNVRARVTIRGISGEAVRDRFTWTYPITIPADGSHRNSLEDNFNFALEYDQTVPGEREIEVRLEPVSDRVESNLANNIRTLRVTFQSNPGFGFYGLRYKYSSAPDALEAPFSEFEPYRDWSERMLPLANLSVLRYPGDPVGNIPHRLVRNTMGMWGDEGYNDARDWAQGMIDRLFPRGGQWVALMQPEVTTTSIQGKWGLDPIGNHVISFNRNPLAMGPALAHELGHSLGQTVHAHENPAFPHPAGGLGPQTGLKTGAYPYQLFSEPGCYDIMSYGYPVWISPYTYTEILRHMTGGRISVLPEVRNARLDGFNNSLPGFASQTPGSAYNTKTEAAQPYLYVSGRIQSNGKAVFAPFEMIESEEDIRTAPGNKNYVLVFEDGTGKALASQYVDLKEAVDDKDAIPSKSFSLYAHMAAGVKRIVLKKENTILAERVVSANFPKVAIFSPSGELSGKQTISWTAEDADKDSLTYSVWYAADTKKWIPLAINLTKTHYEVNCDNLPGSGRAQFRVLATDGVNTTEAHTTAMIRIALKSPEVVILQSGSSGSASSPDQHQSITKAIEFSGTNPLILSGTAYDREDNQSLDLTAMQWRSDKDGELGVGSWTVIRNLSPGKHVITLSITDSHQMKGSASVEVAVQDNKVASPAKIEYTGTDAPLQNEMAGIGKSGLIVYPNPGTDVITLTWNDLYKGPLHISVLDASGKTAMSFDSKKDHVNYSGPVNVRSLKPGIYFLQVKMKNNQVITIRFIKN